MNASITLFLDALIYGFCFTTLIVYSLSIFKFERLKRINNGFFNYSIKVIRVIAIIYFVYYVLDLTNYFLYKDHTLFTERATGPYRFAYWIMLLRPFVFCLFIQLLWFEKFKKKGILNFLLVFVVLFLVLASGANIERYIIIITSFHRDYAPDSFYLGDFEVSLLQLILIGIIERIIIYCSIIFVVYFIHKKLIVKSLK